MTDIITKESLSELPGLMQRIQEAAMDGGCSVEIKALDERTAIQNRAMWASLNDLSRQVLWYGQKLSAEEWKWMLGASLEKQKAVPAIDGQGFVVLGQSTRKMSKKKMAELITLIHAFGAEKRVAWSDPNLASLAAEYDR